MWFGFLLVISFAALLLVLIYHSCGAYVRERPALLFTIGMVTACGGVLLWGVTELFAASSSFLCPRIGIEDCGVTGKIGSLTGKLIEIGFAALGAGLMALAIDIRSREALDTANRRFETKAKKVQRAKFAWRRAFDKLGEELDDITCQERVRRYKQLQDQWWDIEDQKDELREEFGRWRLENPDDDEHPVSQETPPK